MKNREIYRIDPSKQKLENDGVARVSEARDEKAEAILRWEVESFVCKGEYELGMQRILDSFLKNLNEAEQQAVWVSGFYGSGKSHLVKMIRAFWENQTFADGNTAQELATLPPSIKDLLIELDREGKRHGGLHAASGTLKAGGTESVALALLSIVFKSAGLPGDYPTARFVMKLKQDGILDEVKAGVKKKGGDWEEELVNFYVAESLYETLTEVQPKVYPPGSSAAEILPKVFPPKKEITTDELIHAIQQAVTTNGQMPLTLIVLDEVQQYIGQNADRSLDVQEVVEACSKQLGSRVLFVGTGQSAISGTPHLQKLQGRFKVRVELSDTDVDSVIRQVILDKQPTAVKPLEQILDNNSGEISRHLAGTNIAHRQEDRGIFAQDYPLLPVRRRFWENTLRVLDLNATESQVRNQLSMVHNAIRQNLDEDIGHVIGADFLYWENATKLQQASILPRKVFEATRKWKSGSHDEQLQARACGLIFLINRLASYNTEIGIQANVESIADLLVEDLPAGSGKLRQLLPKLLDSCNLLMKVGNEYRIQTEEGAAWTQEFQAQRGQIGQEPARIEDERDRRLKNLVNAYFKQNLQHYQGKSHVPRQLQTSFDAHLPKDAKEKIYLWVRSGWDTDKNSVLAEAKAAGNDAATIFLFIQKQSTDALRNAILDFKAADMAINMRGTPHSAEAQEAASAMETKRRTSEQQIQTLLQESLDSSQMFQAGGVELQEATVRECLGKAAQISISRLYDQFGVADQVGWDKVYTHAKGGTPDALKYVGYKGEIDQHPVCKAVMKEVGAGKTGKEVREHFLGSPYGWPQDALDAVLFLLLQQGQLIGRLPNGKTVDPKTLERRVLNQINLKQETAQVGVQQRIEIRGLMTSVQIAVKPNQELDMVPAFLEKVKEIAQSAGGDGPKPEIPDLSFLKAIEDSSGNDQLLGIHVIREELQENLEKWQVRAGKIATRLRGWETLENLLFQAQDLDVSAYQIQTDKIRQDRLLLQDPDPVSPLTKSVSQFLQVELNKLKEKFDEAYKAVDDRLAGDENWGKLNPQQHEDLLKKHGLSSEDRIEIVTTGADKILEFLDKRDLKTLEERRIAIPGRLQALIEETLLMFEPQIQFVDVDRRLIQSQADIDDWAKDMQQKLQDALKNGPATLI